jgi:chaperonin GroEL (HSP60 family)
VDEIERAFDDALGVVGLAFNDGKLVAGGGAIHAWLSHCLRNIATTKGGRVGMAIESFANALEVIPRTLAENAGLDPVDTILDLRRHQSFTHGVSTEDGIVDMIDEGVIEPRNVISNAISAATEASVMVLRIDDVISMKGGAPPGPPPMGM